MNKATMPASGPVTCPTCGEQSMQDFTSQDTTKSFKCPKCGNGFRAIPAIIRSKQSHLSRAGGSRDFRVRIWDRQGDEQLLEFHKNGSPDFELRSGDFAVFVLDKNGFRLVHNYTIGQYVDLRPPEKFSGLYFALAIVAVVAAVVLVVAVRHFGH